MEKMREPKNKEEERDFRPREFIRLKGRDGKKLILRITDENGYRVAVEIPEVVARIAATREIPEDIGLGDLGKIIATHEAWNMYMDEEIGRLGREGAKGEEGVAVAVREEIGRGISSALSSYVLEQTSGGRVRLRKAIVDKLGGNKLLEEIGKLVVEAGVGSIEEVEAAIERLVSGDTKGFEHVDEVVNLKEALEEGMGLRVDVLRVEAEKKEVGKKEIGVALVREDRTSHPKVRAVVEERMVGSQNVLSFSSSSEEGSAHRQYLSPEEKEARIEEIVEEVVPEDAKNELGEQTVKALVSAIARDIEAEVVAGKIEEGGGEQE